MLQKHKIQLVVLLIYEWPDICNIPACLLHLHMHTHTHTHTHTHRKREKTKFEYP